jgi:hypothetical protein
MKTIYLVDRFCNLATTRRAGLFDYPQLREANSDLRQFESYLSEIRAKLARESGGELTKNNLSNAYAELDKVATGENGRNGIIQGGLPYRVEQSATYWRYFNNLLVDLRTKPVGDYRDYRELANRRLGDIYGEIVTIGGHYREQAKRIDDIANQLQIFATEKQSKMSMGMQKIGEIGFFTFPFTNYATEVFEKFVSNPKYLEEHPELVQSVTAGWFLFGCIVIAREPLGYVGKNLGKGFSYCAHEAGKGVNSTGVSLKKSAKNFSELAKEEKIFLRLAFSLTKEQITGSGTYQFARTVVRKTVTPILRAHRKIRRGLGYRDPG